MKRDKKIAVITGSAGGLGKEFAQRLLRSGDYRVCLSDINEKLGHAACQELRQTSGCCEDDVSFVVCDVTSLKSVSNLWQEAVRSLKSEAVDLWVNNAGVMGEKEGWEKCIDINLVGVLNGITVAISGAAATTDKGQTDVTVVNVASILGLFSAKQPKGWAYNTSKSAVVTASRCIGYGAKNVRMLCLCPSVTATPILEACTPKEVEEMGQQVGGLMTASQVGTAFENLLKVGRSGDVMAVWKDCPPYFIPDTGMGLFIAYTTAAMMFRFTPASLTPDTVRPWPHMVACLIAILLMWAFFGQLTIWIGSALLLPQ